MNIQKILDILKPFAQIAEEYRQDGLDESRPYWIKNGVEKEREPKDVELYSGSGGKPLINLKNIFDAESLYNELLIEKSNAYTTVIQKIIKDDIYSISIYANGTVEFWLNNQTHRTYGPAVINYNGDLYWYKYNHIHRTDGPAVIYHDGRKEYWINGTRHSNITSNEELLLFDIIK